STLARRNRAVPPVPRAGIRPAAPESRAAGRAHGHRRVRPGQTAAHRADRAGLLRRPRARAGTAATRLGRLAVAQRPGEPGAPRARAAAAQPTPCRARPLSARSVNPDFFDTCLERRNASADRRAGIGAWRHEHHRMCGKECSSAMHVLKRCLALVPLLALATIVSWLPTAAFRDRRYQARARVRGLDDIQSINTDASGSLRVQIHGSGSNATIDYTLTYTGLAAPVTQSHIHFANPRVNGGIVIWLCQTAASPAPAWVAAV